MIPPTVFLWSPQGQSIDFRCTNGLSIGGQCDEHVIIGSIESYNRGILKGTWYHGPIGAMPTDCLLKKGWVLESSINHSMLETVLENGKVMCLLAHCNAFNLRRHLLMAMILPNPNP